MSRRGKGRHREWNAVAELPAAVRIKRRVAGTERWKYVDDTGVLLATQEGQDLWTDGRLHKFTVSGVLNASTKKVIIPMPSGHSGAVLLWRQKTLWRKKALRINLGDESWIGWTARCDLWLARWNTAAIVNQAGETLLTLRWLPEGRCQPFSFFGKGGVKFKDVCEAVIAPDIDFPVPAIILAAYAFALFDAFSTGPSGS